MHGPLVGRIVGGVVAIGLAALAACGAADEAVDPGELELRDLLGVAPRAAMGWNADQRAAARALLAKHLELASPLPVATATLRRDPAIAPRTGAVAERAADDAVTQALAGIDDQLAEAGRDAVGLVVWGAETAGATAHTLAAAATVTYLRGEPPDPLEVVIELDTDAWPCATQPACDRTVLSTLAQDAADADVRVRISPEPELPVIAALTTGSDGLARLLVNPIVAAVAESAILPSPGPSAATSIGGQPDRAAPFAPAITELPLVTSTWVYPPTIAECALQIQADCRACLQGGACEPIWPNLSGADACARLDASAPRNYQLLCVNLAVSLPELSTCISDHQPTCAYDDFAIQSVDELSANASFLDTAICNSALAGCLTEHYGSSGADGGCGGCDSCGDSCSLGSSDDNVSTNSDGCAGCGGCGSCDSEGDSASGDDGCGSNGDGTNDGGGCGSCGGDGGNCSGDGGGCSGGGDSCNNNSGGGSCAVTRRPTRVAGLAMGFAWAILPVPAGLLTRRRTRRREVRAADRE